MIRAQQVLKVRDIRRRLEPLPDMILQAADVRQELAEYATGLAEIDFEPTGPIEAAKSLLATVSTWSDGTYIGHGRHAVTRVIDHLDVWLAGQPDTPSDRFPTTEAEQIQNAGDVSRRIRSGLAQADLRAAAGALGGDREDID